MRLCSWPCINLLVLIINLCNNYSAVDINHIFTVIQSCYMYLVSYAICMFVVCCRLLNSAIVSTNMIDKSLTDNCADGVLFMNNSQFVVFAN